MNIPMLLDGRNAIAPSRAREAGLHYVGVGRGEASSITSESRENGGRLHVLASGQRPPDPAQLLAGGALDGFFDDIKESEYDYVLLDGPPLIGLVDSQVLAQRVDGEIVVCRPDRLTSETAIDMRELLQRLRAPALGLVVIGGRSSPISYFES